MAYFPIALAAGHYCHRLVNATGRPFGTKRFLACRENRFSMTLLLLAYALGDMKQIDPISPQQVSRVSIDAEPAKGNALQELAPKGRVRGLPDS